MTAHIHVLKGCSPTPLANYLKALGIFRLVSGQADSSARGWWDGECFCLLTKLSKQELIRFFLDKYEPTPLVAPWNGGSGFFPQDNRKAITAIVQSKSQRFETFRTAISIANHSKGDLKAKPDKKQKPVVFRNCVKAWRGLQRAWLDAAVVFNSEGKPAFPSLLGTGGNDGRLDFTNNFMQQLAALFDLETESGHPKNAANELLDGALWITPSTHLAAAAIGQYQPGAAGGANSSTGFASGNLVNPWDFVLMMEGAILFSSRATKRLDPVAFSLASAPFAVRPHAAGFPSSGAEKAQRGEQWMPLWKQPATLAEIASMLGEARIQIDRQPANRPIDVARAISRLGVARGIDAFVRYGYLERNGQSTLAVSLGRIQVRNRPRAYLIEDLACWCDRIGRRSRDTNAPARLVRAERRLADAIFAALTHDTTSERWQAILLAAADIEAIQATGTAVEAGPIPALHPDWAEAIADGSAEIRLALALGSAAAAYTEESAPIDSVRHHFLPLDRWGRLQVREKRLVRDPRVVAFGRDPIRDLAAIVERRLIESEMKGQRRSRLIAAPGCGARPEDLARFLGGSLDMSKLLDLARALMAITWKNHRIAMHSQQTNISDDMPEECWLAVRLACLPWSLGEGRDIPADLRMVRLLNSGDAGRAVDVARARLRSIGIRPPMQAGMADAASARRWAAALAFPMDSRTAFHCLNRIDPILSLKKGK